MPDEPPPPTPGRICTGCLGSGEVLVFHTPPGATTRPMFAPCPNCGDQERKPATQPTTGG